MFEYNEDSYSNEEESPDVSTVEVTRPVGTCFPDLDYSSIAAWGRLLSGTVLSIGGMVAGAYVLRNVEQPTGWAITSFSVGAAGFYLTGRSLRKLWCPSNEDEDLYNLEQGTAADYEDTYFAQHPEATQSDVILAEFNAFSRPISETHAFSRQNSESRALSQQNSEFIGFSCQNSEFSDVSLQISEPSPPMTWGDNSSDITLASLSDVSSDILNLDPYRSDYLPKSTDLSFRPSDKDRGKRKTCVKKEWSSAPTILQEPKEDFVIAMNLEVNVEKVTEDGQEPSRAQSPDTEVVVRRPSEESLLSEPGK